MSPVDQALNLVRQHAARPLHAFDPYALIGALEHLDDVPVVLHMPMYDASLLSFLTVKKLSMTPRLGNFDTHGLGDELEKEVTRMMVKLYKPTTQPPRFFGPFPRVPYRSFAYLRMDRFPSPNTRGCYNCRRVGHFPRNCQRKSN